MLWSVEDLVIQCEAYEQRRGKSGVSLIDKFIYAVAIAGLCAPILLGAFMLYSACFRRSWGKGKHHPVTLNMRLFAGSAGLLLLFGCVRELVRFLARYSK